MVSLGVIINHWGSLGVHTFDPQVWAHKASANVRFYLK